MPGRGDNQRALAAEMQVDHAARETRAGDDLGHGCATQPDLDNRGECRVDQCLPVGSVVLGHAPWCGQLRQQSKGAIDISRRL